MIVPSFSKIKDFTGDIARKTNELEKAVGTSFDNVASQGQPKLVPTNLKTAAYVASLDDLVVCSGSFSLTLPTANATNAGREVGLVIKSGTITVSSPGCLVQGGDTDAPSVLGRYIYRSDGVGWWRPPNGVTSVTAGAGLVGGGTGAVTIDVAAADSTIVVSADAIRVGVITSANVDSSIVTDASLALLLAPIRQEMEMIRLLTRDLLLIEQGAAPEYAP